LATLEQLDNWGSMDALDSYGNLEQLDTLTLHQPTASVSLAATVSASMKRILAFAASVSGVASVSVYASFIARFTAAVSTAITSTAAFNRTRQVSAEVATLATSSSVAYLIRGVTSSISTAITTAADNAVTFVMSSAVDVAVTQATVARRLGDSWIVLPDEGEVWKILNPFPATLEELDSLGSLERLDIYGSLDDFDDFDITVPAAQWTTVAAGSERWAVK